jgi:putative tryptophan/tyrosine transport system substrate-binding protein
MPPAKQNPPPSRGEGRAVTRRAALALLGGAALAWPRAAQAQQAAKVYRLAVVHPSQPVADLSETGLPRYRAFFQKLRELGYIEGQNLRVERYSGEGRTELFAELAAEVIRGKPDLIFVPGSRLTLAFKAATDTIPVVTVVSDPVAFGVVSNLARPGGNITGVTTDAGVDIRGKRFELLREMVPAASRVAHLASRRVWEGPECAAVREAVERIKVSLVGPPLDAPLDDAEYRRVFAAIVEAGADALVVSSQNENLTKRRLIVELAEKARLPAIYAYREYTDIGGLMAYGPDIEDVYRQAADRVDQILKGAKPRDIPFYQPTKFELVINLKTAKALGLDIPGSILARADEVIE